ncbi:Telomere-associated protein RIF1 [Camponotus floridanus]|uniref:Telomere-associated protein RIF1 n=1 Tax=Camponotus floridanus TaxID=104421 RepID=E1ZXU9_CAMFO|nr:Telomere-associated protein RIF1 [Camponotus floridanus]
MATITSTTFPRVLKILRENNNVKEKREVLTYISSQAKKLESSGTLKEDRYKELCRLVIEAFTRHEGSMQNEALGALNAIVKEFKTHSLHLFESMLQTDKRTRLKILKLLEVVEDNAISAAANDGQALNFFKDCMDNVQPNLMEWLMPTACVDNLQMLTKVEHQPLSDEQKLDEDTNSYALILLRRLYRLAAITFDQNVQRFDTLLMDKIIILAYMGHKRQRGPALKVLQQAVATNSSSRIRKDYPNLWTQYKTNLQSTYCKRMLLLVAACDPDWTIQWNTTIQFLATDLHRGATLINNLLSVEEKAFKSTDPIIRRQAFLSWKLLIDNFALDHQELATPRRIKLLCIPLNTKNSKTELIALTKLEVWWHLIIKLYKDIAKFATPVITQFLNYCFGPLGDTPLLSSKFDVVASPGKRFFKTKVVAVDALCQLVVTKEDLIAVCAPMLEERLPHAISDEVFQECSKSIIHSVGEALLILGQLTDQEMKNRFQLAEDEFPSIVQLILDVVITSFNNVQNLNSEIALKMLSAILTTVYGHNPQKVASMWDCVIKIFKGLNKQLDYELLSSFKETIIIAMNHSNPDLRSLTQSIFEVKDCLDSNAKCIVDEIEEAIEKSYPKSDSVTKKKAETEQTKEIHIAGSFLNRKSTNTKSVSSKAAEKTDKYTLILPEPDSQDYVYIKTDLKFDVNRLTEHQKESLKKKREDIPALYNDLSQSSSQNSQNLQEWFDIKVKHINETDKISNRKSDSITQKLIDNDANKENKIMQTKSANWVDKVVDSHISSELDVNIEENIADTKQNEDLINTVEKMNSNEKQEENEIDISKQTNSAHTASISEQNTAEINEKIDATTTIVKKLNFESREEFSENKIQERQSSPSMLDSIKRRHRNSIKLNSSLKSDEVVESQKDSSATNIQRTLRMKISQEKPGTNSKQKSDDDIDIKESYNENKKGIKRKYTSDTESDGIQRRKRKSFNDDTGETSRSSDSLDIDMENVSQRVKNEISRLKIDMVFDCPVVNRRRVKHLDEGEKETFIQEIDAGKKHGLRKYGTLDNKNFKQKSLDGRFVEGSKRFSKTQERNTKDADDTDPGIFKRRGRRSIRQEPNKSDLDINKDVKKSTITNTIDKVQVTDTIDKMPEWKNSDTDMTDEVSTSSQVIQDVTISKDETSETDNSKFTSLNVESSESSKQSEDEIEEVESFVESSQIPNIDVKLDKICGEKQCFIKINKIENIPLIKASDAIIEKNYVPESIPMDCDDNVPDPCKQSDEANLNNTELNDENKDKDSTNKDTIQETNSSNLKIIISEGQKTIENSSSSKSTSITSFSSPKSSIKVLCKLKPFTGRAAHMLGLVTKQAQLEGDNPTIALEDESSIKKLKTKDAENDTSKKAIAIKEIDKINGPSGSRQEKIFSNMRSADYCASPSFTTLKNDGEKLSFKLDKNISDYSSIEISIDKENVGGTSFSCEKDDLPILEWSSANPPSLTASPSASILKRQRSSIPEPDLDSSTPNKRKRVSFADPPVSKEMGYEISNTEFSQKTNKCPTARSPMPRKDSPLKLKQTKLKFVPIDVEKVIIENDSQNESDSETVFEAEKKNESLTKISEADSEAMNIDKSVSDDFAENDNVEVTAHARIKIDEELGIAQEIEITADSFAPSVPENQQTSSSEDSEQNPTDTASMDCVGIEDSETQRDIFDGTDTINNIVPTKMSNDDINTSVQNNSVNSIKLNLINDSVIAALSTKDDNTTSMEDTVDIQNITELNSTVNTDEVFCGKLIRTSTETTENLMDQDTLPVTDSLFASLPLTQESTQSQEAQNNVEPDPELLNSTLPIYPTLSSCAEPIDTIVERLTYPLWKKNLSTHLANRSLRTIGDLAQLSEREINRLPVKGKPKTEFVKKVLEHFESTCMLQAESSDRESNAKVQSPIVAMNKTPIVPISAPPLAVAEAEPATVDNKSSSCSAPFNRPTEAVSNNLSREKSPTESLDKTESITSDMDISLEHIYSQNSDLSILKNEQIDAKEPIAVESSSRTSMDNVKSVPIVSSSESIAVNEIVLPSSSTDTSKSRAKSSNVYEELLITHSSVGTSTEEIGSATPSVQKVTRSVESQMALEELLDEIDVNLVLESAVRRCSPEAILLQYKVKMAHLKETELVKETIRMLGLQNKQQVNDASLKAACRACGVNKVLLRLPDIFSYDKQFFDKVLKVYSKKLNVTDFVNTFDFNQLKNVVCQKITSSELIEMLSEKLKQEEQDGIKQPMTELSSLDAMLQRLPMDVIISHTVANEELIPAQVVLDIALQNNSSGDIAQALKQSPVLARRVLDKLWTSQFTIAHIENDDTSKECLLNIFKSVCSKLTAQELLNAYHEAMTNKVMIKNENK